MYVMSIVVKMQAQRTAPVDMICKDKFLVQGTVVPPGTTDEDITSATVRVILSTEPEFYYFVAFSFVCLSVCKG